MEYLTKTMRRALDTLNKREPDLQGCFYTVQSIPAAPETLEQLVHDGFLTFADKEETVLRVTEKGRCYRELRRRELRTYWFDKFVTFLIGVALGVATTLLTAHLT